MEATNMAPALPGDHPLGHDAGDAHDQGNAYRLLVGNRAHLIAAQALGQGLSSDRLVRAQQLIQIGRAVFVEHPVKLRTRSALMDATTAASAYLLHFAVPNGWAFRGAERPVGGGRADLVFEHTTSGHWLIDELKTGRGRAEETSLRPQITRYLDGGAQLWGDAFLGVRLCAVIEPTASRFYPRGRFRSAPLSDTNLAETIRW